MLLRAISAQRSNDTKVDAVFQISVLSNNSDDGEAACAKRNRHPLCSRAAVLYTRRTIPPVFLTALRFVYLTLVRSRKREDDTCHIALPRCLPRFRVVPPNGPYYVELYAI